MGVVNSYALVILLASCRVPRDEQAELTLFVLRVEPRNHLVSADEEGFKDQMNSWHGRISYSAVFLSGRVQAINASGSIVEVAFGTTRHLASRECSGTTVLLRRLDEKEGEGDSIRVRYFDGTEQNLKLVQCSSSPAVWTNLDYAGYLAFKSVPTRVHKVLAMTP